MRMNDHLLPYYILFLDIFITLENNLRIRLAVIYNLQFFHKFFVYLKSYNR